MAGLSAAPLPWQVVWVVMIGMCIFLILIFFSSVANYWGHIERVGTHRFVEAYLVQTLLIQVRRLHTFSDLPFVFV